MYRILCVFFLMCVSSTAAAKELNDNLKRYVESWQMIDSAQRLIILESLVTDPFYYDDPTTQQVTINSAKRLNQWIDDFHAQMRFENIWPISAQLISQIDSRTTERGSVFRFNWRISSHGTTLIEGTDFGKANKEAKLIEVNGFFGLPIPIKPVSDH
ncbi:hypothetical protein PULV_b0963 [Pseudoalteromonas ulvae UL12]|nr:hypothetical protein [Pseudoalteromonas ulvae]MBE0366205.1 hypothetical protein [Pseudoalteromonas ulvae UL12]